MTTIDSRTPSPPLGYSKPCTHSLKQQIHIVAEFHVYRIKSKRIAYRTGIDIELVNCLLEGREHQKLFKSLLTFYRKSRRNQRVKESLRVKGIAQAAVQEKIEVEYLASLAED